jgi:iron complex transport system permease protein
LLKIQLHKDVEKRSSRALYFGLMAAALIILFIINIVLGSVHIPLREIGSIIFTGTSSHSAWTKIVNLIRLPRAFTAIIAGGALSISGLEMQTLFRNPLAGPSVLGITAGASLGVAAVMLAAGSVTSVFAIQTLGGLGSWAIIGAASLGSGLVMLLILLIAARIRNHVTLLIIGLMIGYITIAAVSIWQYFSAPMQIQNYLLWTFGSLGGVNSTQLEILAVITIIGGLIGVGLSKSMNGLLLGERYAQSMGIGVNWARFWIILSTSLLAGAVTAFCGPIGFIGIAVPHLTRSLLRTNNHRLLIPGTLLTGAALMLACDIIAQVPGSATTLPISAVTSLVGAPVVIWVIMKRQNLHRSF